MIKNLEKGDFVGKQIDKFYKFCPNCSSVNVKLTDNSALVAYRELYVRCVDCGFQAKEFPEAELGFIEEFRKQKVKK